MRLLLAPTLILMFVASSGCGDSHEKLAKEMTSTMREFVTALDGVKDENSAKAAKPKLKSLMERMNGISMRAEKMGGPNEAQSRAMDAKYGKDMEELVPKLQAAMMRVSMDPKISAELQDLDMSKMGG